MKRNNIIILLLALLSSSDLYAQLTFKTVKGTKANYSISIPSDYTLAKIIGGNIDIKYSNSEGASINTVVKNLPSEVSDNDIEQMNIQSDAEFVNQLESNGLENVTVIKRGMKIVNGINSCFAYYKDAELYYHTIMQFRKGKLILLTFTCEYSKKGLYMPIIFRVVNSLKT